jgi:hypothetical protein
MAFGLTGSLPLVETPRRFNIGHVIGMVGMTVKAPGSWPIGDAVRIS